MKMPQAMPSFEVTPALYLEDLFTGLFAAFSLEGVRNVSLRGQFFDKAMRELLLDLGDEARRHQLQPAFFLAPDLATADYSEMIRKQIYDAADRHLISLDNLLFEDITLKITPDLAPFYLERVPGNEEFYRSLARKLIHYYREAACSA